MKAQFFLNFLQHYLDWVDVGALDDNPYEFEVGFALCDNLVNYFYNIPYTKNFITGFKGVEYRVFMEFDAPTLVKDLSLIFAMDGLDRYYPFGEKEYLIEDEMKTHHLNPARLAWIRKQLEGK